MIDLHTHVLPGIDDGAEDLAEAVAMCRLAAAEGCEALVATPHQRREPWWNCDPEELAALRERLQEAVGPSLRLLPGGEIRVDGELLAEVERLPASGLLPLAGSRYLLIEFGGRESPDAAADLVHELAIAGWRPVLAHPELIRWMAGDPASVARLVALGATVQVTAMSLTGDFGRRAQSDAVRLLNAGLVHFVASDCHDTRRRPPGLRRACEVLARLGGGELARRLTAENPRAVIEDRPLPGTARPDQADPVRSVQE
jgi:protein-tyrosine phosphatase